MKPKILFIMHMPPPVHGAAMVGKYIHDSKPINTEFECHYINLTTAKNLEDIGKLRLGKLSAFVRLLFAISRAIKKVHPNLVYITPNTKGGAFYKDFIVMLIIKSFGCKVIAHYHNKGVSVRHDKWFDNFLYKKFFKGIKIILLGKTLYTDFNKYMDLKDVYFCPNGIPNSNIITHKDNKIPHLLFLSNLLIAKGVITLLDSLEMLKSKGYEFTCDFIGGETKDLNKNDFNHEISERNLNNFAFYYGKRFGQDKEQFFNSADIFILPSFDEAFPLVILEAMQHGLPIVATNVGGIEDEVEDGVNGLICPPGNSKILTEKIAYLLEHPEKRQAMGIAGYRKYNKEFTIEKFDNNIYNILAKEIYV